MNVNISNEFNFSKVHGGMNRRASLAKFRAHSLCTRPTAVHTAMDLRKMKFISSIPITMAQSSYCDTWRLFVTVVYKRVSGTILREIYTPRHCFSKWKQKCLVKTNHIDSKF